jgi:sugar lactone lactonase YvrE
MEIETRTIATGFAFPEGPRWHEGKLWFSDQHDGVVHVLAPDGAAVDSFAVPGGPSGMGWLPDGDLLVVSMHERRLYRRHGDALTPYAELSALHPGYSNDMVVDADGRAYVGNIGFDFDAGESYRPTAIALVTPDARVQLAADDVACPNGSVITQDGKILIVAESMGCRLIEFDIGADGTLADRRVFAELGDIVPDGICLDEEGCVWVAAPFAGTALRVRRGGEIVDTASIHGAKPYACMLGGADGLSLYMACAGTHEPKVTVASREGRIDLARVSVGRAGWP